MNGLELKKLRDHYKISQTKFGDIINCLQHQVSEWETNKCKLSDKRLQFFKNELKKHFGY